MKSSYSTISALIPEMANEPARNELRSKLRYSGSRKMMLRRPNRSPDFARQYVAGDPVRFLDWKAFARTDQLIIRETRDKADVNLRIFVDASETMRWPSKEVLKTLDGAVPTKFELALRMALTCAAGHVAAGDVVRLYIGDPGKIAELKVYNFRAFSDVSNFFQNLKKGRFQAKLPPSETDNRLLSGKPSDIALLFSDGFNLDGLSNVATGCSEIAFFQTLSSLELSSDWMSAQHSYFDDSSEGLDEYMGNDLKRLKLFETAVRKFVDQQMATVSDYGWHYQLFHDHSKISHFFGFLSMISEGEGLVVRG